MQTTDHLKVAGGRTQNAGFESWLAEQYSSAQTRKGYAGDVAQFRAWSAGQSEGAAPEVQELTAVEARAWLMQYSGSTHNRKLAALKAWERWGQELGTLRGAPLARVEYGPPNAGAGVKWLDVKERGKVEGWAEKLVGAASTEAARRNAIRNAAMLCVLRYAGLRVSECAALDLADVMRRPRSGEVVVKHGKGNKRRAVPIEHKELIYWLERWLEVRPVSECPALFTNKRGERITRDGIGAAIEEIGRVAGVALTPHTLRHTFGKSLLEASGDRGMVKDLLGHSRLETTLIYTKPGDAEVRAALGRM